MADYYNHIYTALRSSMIDRDAGDKPEDAVLIDFKSAQVALKPEIPSAALLISYSMLFYPGWLKGADSVAGIAPAAHTIETFIGGKENYRFPLLFNIELGMIALAVGCYAGLWTVKYSTILGTVLVSPNMDNPLVIETRKRIVADNLGFSYARTVFVELMQNEEYKGNIILADDYVANATFIQDASASMDDDVEQRIQEAMQVDFSDTFGKVVDKEEV